jgi:hypothetical protein
VLSTDNPKALQRKVWFDVMISFDRRVRENQRQFTKDTFAFKTDDRGHAFVEFARSETTKNHQGGISDNNFETDPRIYATNDSDCPVQALRKYLSKRNPRTDHFFQLSRPPINDRDLTWYTFRPIGEKMLNNMMKNISKMENLTKNYTNHCVRATTSKNIFTIIQTFNEIQNSNDINKTQREARGTVRPRAKKYLNLDHRLAILKKDSRTDSASQILHLR